MTTTPAATTSTEAITAETHVEPTPLQDTQAAIKVGQLLQQVKLLNSYLLGGLISSVIFNVEIINGEGDVIDRMLTYALISAVTAYILLFVDICSADVILGGSIYAILGSTLTKSFGADPYKFNYVGLGLMIGTWFSWMIIESHLEEAIKQPTPPPSAS